MRRQHHRAGRDGHRRHRRRDDRGSLHRHHRAGHRLRRHRRRRRGSYRHRRRHHRDDHLPGRLDDCCHRDRVEDHLDAADDWRHRDAAACCPAMHRRGAAHRDAGRAHLGAAPADGEWPAPPAAPRRTGCCRRAACARPASEPPGADRGLVRTGPRRASHRPAAVRELELRPEPERVAAEPAVQVPGAPRVWERPVWPPGPHSSRRA
jgi:hypothetical protein